MDQADLIRGCINDNRQAQKTLYEKYARKMLGVCICYTNDRFEAENILQEGFLKVFQNLKNYQPTGSFEGWIRRIMVHCAIDYYRKLKRLQFSMVAIEEAEHLTASQAVNHMDVQELVNLIHKLPEGARIIFNLFAVDGYSHKEIAEMLGISEGTSKSQFSRARQMLQSLIKKNERFEPQRHIRS